MSFNKVIIQGRLGRDPEIKYLQSGTAVCNLSVATSEPYTDQDGNKQEKTEWHRVVAFGKTAENCSQYLAKGRQCLVEGKLQTRKWQDQQGNDRYTTEIRADRVVFLGGGQGNQAQQTQPQSQPQQSNFNPYNDNINGPPSQRPGPDQGWQSDEAPFALALIPFAGLLAGIAQLGCIL